MITFGCCFWSLTLKLVQANMIFLNLIVKLGKSIRTFNVSPTSARPGSSTTPHFYEKTSHVLLFVTSITGANFFVWNFCPWPEDFLFLPSPLGQPAFSFQTYTSLLCRKCLHGPPLQSSWLVPSLWASPHFWCCHFQQWVRPVRDQMARTFSLCIKIRDPWVQYNVYRHSKETLLCLQSVKICLCHA